MSKLTVAGYMMAPAFQQAKLMAKSIQQAADNELQVSVLEMFELDWEHYLIGLRTTFSPKSLLSLKDKIVCFHTFHGFIGGFDELSEWTKQRYSTVNIEGDVDFNALASQSLINYVSSSPNDFVSLSISVDNQELGLMAFELHQELKKTCENFKALCTGEKGTNNDGVVLSYLNTPLHRIVKDGWIQGGDIVSGNGDSSVSIFGGVFEDESFQTKHDRAGILSMSNNGYHSNGSQFFVTLGALEYLDTKNVAFGKLIYGAETLKAIGERETVNQRPKETIVISSSGRFDPSKILK